MYSRSSHSTDNGMVAKRRVKKSLRITSQVNDNTHPRSNAAQHLFDEHQLMDTTKRVFSRDDDSNQESMTLRVSKLGAEAFPDIWGSGLTKCWRGVPVNWG